MQVLTRTFYQRPTQIVAQELLGKIIVRNIDGHYLTGIITETEAYGYQNDPASHAYRGKTARTEPMFGSVGCAYIYFIYGNHYCFNVVAKDLYTVAGAVLIRAVQPLSGIEHMKEFRNNAEMKHLTNGPGKLTQALQLNKTHNFHDVTYKGTLWIEDNDITISSIATPRIGIKVGTNLLWRFCMKK